MSGLDVIRLPGLVPYAEAYARQMAEHAAVLADSRRAAKLILLQHAPVYTLGRTAKPEHLHAGSAALAAYGAEVLEIDRGGSVTYHGPGQLMAYLILSLKRWESDIHRHLWNLEEAAIRALGAFGLQGERVEGMTGVWVPLSPGGRGVRGEGESHEKVCSVGVGCRRWVTYHGLCLNVDLDLAPFAAIDPCGLGRKPVTSLAKLLDRRVPLREAEDALVAAVETVFS